MIEELKVIVNELFLYRANSRANERIFCESGGAYCEGLNFGKSEAYTHVINLLNDLIDKHQENNKD